MSNLVAYFLLAYGISWGLILAFLASIGFNVSNLGMTDVLIIFGCMVLGPSVGGLSLTAFLEGRAGLRAYAARLRTWRATPALWATALLTNPLILVLVLVALSALVSPSYTPGFLALGIVFGLLAGAIEELGWTGFATPRLLERLSPVKAGLVLGVLWASWHGLADFAGNIGTMTVGDWALRFVAYWLIPLTAYRVLMTAVYARTRSILVAMVMHASYTGWLMVMTPSPVVPFTASESLVWYVAFAVALTLAVAVIIRLSQTQTAAISGVAARRASVST